MASILNEQTMRNRKKQILAEYSLIEVRQDWRSRGIDFQLTCYGKPAMRDCCAL